MQRRAVSAVHTMFIATGRPNPVDTAGRYGWYHTRTTRHIA